MRSRFGVRTNVEQPARAAAKAASQPACPAPTTTTSTRWRDRCMLIIRLSIRSHCGQGQATQHHPSCPSLRVKWFGGEWTGGEENLQHKLELPPVFMSDWYESCD